MTVHRIIWTTFRGEIPPTQVVNHKNGIKIDNRLENLEVVSQSENIKHGYRTLGRKPSLNGLYGSHQASAKLTDDLVREIRSKFTGRNRSALAREYGLHKTTVARVISRDTWDHVD